MCGATQDGWVIVESSDKTWSAEEGNGNPLQYSCQEEPMMSMKTQKDMTLEDKTPRMQGVQYAPGEEQRAITNSSRKHEVAGPSGNDTQLWMWLVVKVKSYTVKNNIA